MKKFKITKNELLNVAINSVRQYKSLKSFREFVKKAQEHNLLDINMEQFTEENEDKIFGIGLDLREKDKKNFKKLSKLGDYYE